MEQKIGQLEKEADEEERVQRYDVTTKMVPNPLYNKEEKEVEADSANA